MAFIFLDTETSGLDPYIHDISEIGAIYIDDEYKPNLKKVFHKRLLLQNIDNADEEALQVGHYNNTLWEKTGVDAESGLLQFNEWLKEVSPSEKPIIVAQNAEFDKSMIFSNADRFKIYPYIDTSWIDLISLWIIYKAKRQLKHLGNGQNIIAKHFDVKNHKAHAALMDSATGAICFCKIVQSISFN